MTNIYRRCVPRPNDIARSRLAVQLLFLYDLRRDK